VNRPVTTADTAAPERLIRKSEFARLVGVSHAAISRAIRDGRLTPALRLAPDGREVLAYGYARRLWAQCRREPLPQEPGLLQPPAPAADGLPPWRESKARHAHYKAELVRLRVEAMRAALVPAAEVEVARLQCAGSVRAALMALPALLAPQLAATNDLRAVHVLLSETFRVELLRLTGEA
jgi:hypothetical protein